MTRRTYTTPPNDIWHRIHAAKQREARAMDPNAPAHRKPRCALTVDGNIEAAYDLARRLEIDPRTGTVIASTVKEGTDEFRRLVRTARQFVIV